jgi:hypothetical protein
VYNKKSLIIFNRKGYFMPRSPVSSAKNQIESMFVPLYLDFELDSVTVQAKMILQEAESFHSKGYQQVGITYSANHDQTVEIRNVYRLGGWLTETKGGGQAQTIAEIERLLGTPEYKHLRHVFRILPISTCAHAGGKGGVKMEWLEEDLTSIKKFLDRSGENNIVLGWQNQLTQRNNSFAIGGGFSDQLSKMAPGRKITKNQFIQEALKTIAEDYPGANQIDASERKLLNQYKDATQNHLKHLRSDSKLALFIPKKIRGEAKPSPLATQKIEVVTKLLATLKSDQNPAEKIQDFHNLLAANKKVFATRRDNAFTTFMKALGVVAASILLLGVGATTAYDRTFGKKATHGQAFVSDIEKASTLPKNRK